MAKYLQKAKLVPKDLGNPRVVTADDAFKDGQTMPLGRFYGEVSDVVTKADATGRMFDELRGQFKGIPSKQLIVDGQNIDGVISGRAFLPTGFHELVVAAWKGGGDGALVQFAYDLGVKRAENPIGYEWVAVPIFPLQAGERDPFAALETKIAEATKPAITDQTGTAAAARTKKEAA